MDTNNKKSKQPLSKGVRELSIKDMLPKCDIIINKELYDIKKICKNKKVVDVGCGFGHNKKIIDEVGGEWIGVEPFEEATTQLLAVPKNCPLKIIQLI